MSYTPKPKNKPKWTWKATYGRIYIFSNDK
jgi:hypothetical protein